MALGRAWILLGSRKNPMPEKCLTQSVPQDSQRPMQALLAGFLFCNALLAVKNRANIHQLPVVIAPARS
jgi:hypothetical protein